MNLLYDPMIFYNFRKPDWPRQSKITKMSREVHNRAIRREKSHLWQWSILFSENQIGMKQSPNRIKKSRLFSERQRKWRENGLRENLLLGERFALLDLRNLLVDLAMRAGMYRIRAHLRRQVLQISNNRIFFLSFFFTSIRRSWKRNKARETLALTPRLRLRLLSRSWVRSGWVGKMVVTERENPRSSPDAFLQFFEFRWERWRHHSPRTTEEKFRLLLVFYFEGGSAFSLVKVK